MFIAWLAHVSMKMLCNRKLTWVPSSRNMPRCADSRGRHDMQTLARLHGFKRSLSQSCWRRRKELGRSLKDLKGSLRSTKWTG